MPSKQQLGRNGKAYTPEDAALLYQNNETFRRLANRVAVLMIDPAAKGGAVDAKKPEGQAVAIAAANASRDLANALKRATLKGTFISGSKVSDVKTTVYYVHPALILFWMKALINPELPKTLEQFKTGQIKDAKDVQLLPNPEITALLIQNFRVPTMAAGKWLSILQRLNVNAMPHWLVTSVEPLRSQANGVVGGFPLKSLTVRIPLGANRIPDTRAGYSKYGPAHFQNFRIDMQSGEIKDLFGQVWMGYTADKKSMFLASEKGGTLSFEQFMSILANSRQSSSRPRFPEALAKEDYTSVGSVIPDAFKTRLDSMNRSPLATSVKGIIGVDRR